MQQEQVAAEQGKSENQLYFAPTTLITGGRRQGKPAIAFGVPLSNSYQLYFVFPLTEEQQTLQLVQTTLIGVGIALVALLAAIASLVTRWVVLPVRHAARAAQRLSAGQLEERMVVGGADDLAPLATSFNEMADSLQEKLQQLEELSKAQRQFVSDVSHELRTPMTTIRMAAEILFESREDLDPAAARSTELLQSQIERFETLLTDLLEISRHDSNVATLDAEPADLCDIVRRSADDAQQLAERRGCRIEFRLPVQACMAEVDRRRVERILRNLLVNAVEHGEGRDVVVTVAADRDAVAVAVRDHGVGLAPGEEQLVFERFWRADPSRARTVGGTGLGLAISLEDARLHGGWLQAWGEKGRGSVFRLTLPTDRRAAARRLAAAARPRRGGDRHQRRHHAGCRPGGRQGDDAGYRAAARGRRGTRRRRWPRWPRVLIAACRPAACRCRPAGPVQSYPVTQGTGRARTTPTCSSSRSHRGPAGRRSRSSRGSSPPPPASATTARWRCST